MKMVVGDHIGYRFEILSRLGKGSFGQVSVFFIHSVTPVCKQWHPSSTAMLQANVEWACVMLHAC